MRGARPGLSPERERRRVLFLCTQNSARSQMAEGLLRALAGDRFDLASAGTEATRVHPLAVRAMAEIGIDRGHHTLEGLDRFLDAPWDDVITVCDAASACCPVFRGGARRLHWSFDDPSATTGTEEERLEVFRRLRDEIAARIRAGLPTSGDRLDDVGRRRAVVGVVAGFFVASASGAPTRSLSEYGRCRAGASRAIDTFTGPELSPGVDARERSHPDGAREPGRCCPGVRDRDRARRCASQHRPVGSLCKTSWGVSFAWAR